MCDDFIPIYFHLFFIFLLFRFDLYFLVVLNGWFLFIVYIILFLVLSKFVNPYDIDIKSFILPLMFSILAFDKRQLFIYVKEFIISICQLDNVLPNFLNSGEEDEWKALIKSCNFWSISNLSSSELILWYLLKSL